MEYAGPFADIHRHGEANAWLDGILAEREGRVPFDWAVWRDALRQLPPGPGRLLQMQGPMANEVRNRYLDQREFSILVLEACLESAASSGAILAELRVGANASIQPGFIEQFREAESRVRTRHPAFAAVPILSGLWPDRAGAMECIEACIEAGPGAFGGIDFIPFPYEENVDWSRASQVAERCHTAGFGITAHAGEFTSIHLAPAIDLPGLSRLGHGTRLDSEPALLQRAIDRGVVIEACPSSNVLLGSVESLEEHPLRRFVDSGAQVVIATDDPARFGISISGEYQAAARLGLASEDLSRATRTAIERSFVPAATRAQLLAHLDSTIASGLQISSVQQGGAARGKV